MRTFKLTPFQKHDFDPFQVFKEFEKELGNYWLESPRRVETHNGTRYKETEEAFLFTFDLPGVSNKDIDVNVEGDVLSVKAKRHDHFAEGGDQYLTFERSFKLPQGVNNESVQAHYENGVLAIALPKEEKLKAKKVEVTGGEKSKGFLSLFGLNMKTETEPSE
jgi:HSP20 family protein